MDFRPEETHEALRRMASEFAQKEIHPVIEEIDREKDPEKRFPHELLKKGSQLGLRTLAAPEEKGGGGADPLTLCFVGEELGWGDLGIGVTFALDWCVSLAVERLRGGEDYSRYLGNFLEDESAHLTTVHIPASPKPEDLPPYEDEAGTPPLRAERAGDGWVLNGVAPHVTNGRAAKHYLISFDAPERAIFLVDASDLAGVRTTRFHDNMGMRSCQDVDLLFENCRISEEHRLAPADGPGQWPPEWEKSVQPLFWIIPCAAALGTARRAHEAALEHARERVQGGKPIIGHQTVGFMLCENLAEMNASRRLLQASAWAASRPESAEPRESILARVFVSECCERIARRSMEVWGGAGYMTEAPMERYLRDMTSFMHADEMVHSLRARAMTML